MYMERLNLMNEGEESMGAVCRNRISIIVPVFNAEKHIERCLLSLIDQTYKDIEILVIDDGSQDNSLNIIKEYAEHHPKIRFFSQKNSGAGAARNLGLKNTSGEYIMFCDADDTIETQMCENMLDTMINQQVDVVMCNTRIHRSRLTAIPREGDSYEFSLKQGKYFANSSSLGDMNVYVWNKIFKKVLIDQFDIAFAEDCKRSEDVLFVHKYMSVVESAFALYEHLYNHYEVEGSLMYEFETESITLQDLLDKIYLLDIFYDFLRKNDIFDKNKKYFTSRFSKEMTYAWQCTGENWERTFLEMLGVLMGKTNIDDWGSTHFNLLAASLGNRQYERSARCLDELLISQGTCRNGNIAQKSIEPAFAENNVAIFLSSDNNYVPYLAVTLVSLIENSNPDFNYDMVILNEGITSRNKDILKNFVEKYPHCSLRFFSMGYYSSKYDIASFFISAHITTPSYYRIFAPLIFKNYNRIVYLDCDLIVNTDISELFSLPFKNKSILAAPDYCVCQPTYSPKYRQYAQETLKIKNLSRYFNAGVQVFNLQKIREKGYITEFLRMSKIKAVYHDQDILNSVLQDDSHLIAPEWNYQIHCKNNTDAYLSFYQPLKSIKILHFSSFEKPWQTLNNDFAEIWWAYARKSPFYEQIVCKTINSDVALVSNMEDLACLKRSFWYNRILSKITFGETQKRYATKKSLLRSRINAVQKQKN